LPDGFISVTDDTGTLSIAVPDGWTADTTPRPYGFFDDSLGAEYPTIKATAHADDPDGQSSSLFLQTVPAADPEREGLYGDYGVDCPEMNLRTSEYARDPFGGQLSDSGACGGNVARHTIVAAFSDESAPEGTSTIIVDFQATSDADDQLFDAIADSFEVAGPAPDDSSTPQGVANNLPPAMPTDPDAVFGVWTYEWFWNVPQLGTEPVRGSGCGASEQIGPQIPDGLWAGYLSYDPDTDAFSVDLLCIFYGDTADAVRAEGTANIVHDEPDYLIVSNSDGRREVANNTQVALGSGLTSDDNCAVGSAVVVPEGESHLTSFGESLQPDLQAWIRIDGGAVTWFVYGCDLATVGPGG